jgi:hypothetical protein
MKPTSPCVWCAAQASLVAQAGGHPPVAAAHRPPGAFRTPHRPEDLAQHRLIGFDRDEASCAAS